MKKKIFSVGLVFVFVLSLISTGVFAQTADVTDPVEGYVDLTEYATALDTAQKQEGYTRTYYFLTYQLVNTGAVLEWMAINRPGEQTNEVAVLQAFYDAVLKLRTEMTADSDFNAILSKMKAESQKTGTALSAILNKYYTELPEIKGYIYAYRAAHTEDDVAHDIWGGARVAAVYAYEAFLVADLGNTVALAEYYTPEETQAIAQMETYIAKIQSIADTLAAAAKSFDEAKVTSLTAQIHSTSDQADALAAAMWEKIFAAYREMNGPVY